MKYFLYFLQNDILKVIPSNESDVIQKYLQHYVTLLANKINEYQNQLNTQKSSCPATLPSPEIFDKQLKEFVRLHHCDLLRKVNYQIGQLNTKILIQRFSQQLSSFNLTTTQVLSSISNRILVTLHLFRLSL